MIAWKAVQLEDCPYRLALGYKQFWQGTNQSQPKLAYSGTIHFGKRDVTADLPG